MIEKIQKGRKTTREPQNNDSDGLSLYQLNHINRHIQHDQDQTHRLREQIKLQQFTSNKLNKDISEQINKVKDDGIFYAARLEEEKHRHENLCGLVQHYRKQMYEEKLLKYQDSKNKKLSEEYNVLFTKLKQIEKAYDQIVLKANTSLYEVTKKIDQVRMMRSERTIFCKLFDQFERELFQLELNYKQMVIERSFLETLYRERINEFQYIEIKAEQEQQRILRKQMKQRNKRTEQDQQMEERNLVEQLHFSCTSPSREQSTEMDKRYGKSDQTKKGDKKSQRRQQVFVVPMEKMRTKAELEKIQYERKVKQLHYKLQILKTGEIPQKLQSIQSDINILYGKANILYEEIYKRQKQLERIQSRGVDRSEKKKRRGGKIIDLEKQAQAEKEKTQKEVSQFECDIKNVWKKLKGTGTGESSVMEVVRDIDKILGPLLPQSSHPLCQKSSEKPSLERLNTILTANRSTKNTTNIYSQEDLIAISKYNLQMIDSEEKKGLIGLSDRMPK